MPPPSIVPSTRNISPTARPYSTRLTPLVALERKEKQLQRDIQTLLDAQGEGLLAGLEGQSRGDGSSEGSSTPTAASMGASRIMPIRQPPRKRIGLRAARRGILMAIREYAMVKEDEKELLDAELQSKEGVLGQVETWEKKRKGLNEKIDAIESGDDGKKVGELKDEAKRVQSEIEELETRLFELQNKHRNLLSEASSIENSVQSKLSSYKASLSILDSQVARFLARPTFAHQQPSSSSATAMTSKSLLSNKMNFLSLQPRRRTLEMARDYLQDVRKDLLYQRATAEMERDALEDGAVVWEDVISEVTAFERKLRGEMRGLRSPSATPASPGSGLRSPLTPTQRTNTSSTTILSPNPPPGLPTLLQTMASTILQLESKFKLAEARDWKLLVCCIGAELEAFREGKAILEDALLQATPPDPMRGTEGRGIISDDGFISQDSGDPLGVMGDHGREHAHGHGLTELLAEDEHPSHARAERSESEDEGPDPMLLFEREDTD
ncbi:MAG: hypothetical protein M1839_001769 [Geoglossum umbratile]|nr:MAG: hypothetical protein M1839_001769 [Geoglossum umbratile]